jgi:hypothetical protein
VGSCCDKNVAISLLAGGRRLRIGGVDVNYIAGRVPLVRGGLPVGPSVGKPDRLSVSWWLMLLPRTILRGAGSTLSGLMKIGLAIVVVVERLCTTRTGTQDFWQVGVGAVR